MLRRSHFIALYVKEVYDFFVTPLAAVFMVVFLVSSLGFATYIGGFFENNQANLTALFRFVPWFLIVLVPALTMRLWAEEKRQGTLEILWTQPVSVSSLVLAKFAANWTLVCLTLALTFPMWLVVNWLGSPDNGVLLAAYLGAFLMAGAYCALGSLFSGLATNQVSAFIFALLACFLMSVSGSALVTGLLGSFLPESLQVALANLSLVYRFERIARGVLDFGDMGFYLSVMGLTLSGQIYLLSRKQKTGGLRGLGRGVFSIPGGLLATSLALAGFGSALQIDLTEQKIYSLSQASRGLTRGLTEDYDLHLYVSPELVKRDPRYGQYADRVARLVEELVGLSSGKLRLYEHRPQAWSSEEDDALAFGLSGIPIDENGTQIFFGLAVEPRPHTHEEATPSADASETTVPETPETPAETSGDLAAHTHTHGEGTRFGRIAFLNPDREAFLEYDIMKMLTELDRKERPRVGVVTALQPFGDFQNYRPGLPPPRPWIAFQEAQEAFDFEPITQADQLAEQSAEQSAGPSAEAGPPDVLLVLHPSGLSDSMLYAMDQFVLGGRNVLLFYDPRFESRDTSGRFGPPAPGQSNLGPLLEAWGITIPDKKVVADWSQALRVNAGPEQGARTHLAWFQTRSLNQTVPFMQNFEHMNFISAGAISVQEPLAFIPLVESASPSAVLETQPLEAPVPDLTALLDAFQDGEDTTQTVAGLITGRFQTAYPDGPPPPPEQAPEANPEASLGETPEETPGDPLLQTHRIESSEASSILVVSDVDFLQDRFWVRRQEIFGQTLLTPTAHNGAFFLGALDFLTGQAGLGALRARGTSARTFTYIDQVHREAEQEFRAVAEELEAKIVELQNNLNNPEQTETSETADAEIRAQLLTTRQRLRDVRHQLNRDVENLKTGLSLFVLITPVFLVLLGQGLWHVYRRRRLRRLAAGLTQISPSHDPQGRRDALAPVSGGGS